MRILILGLIFVKIIFKNPWQKIYHLRLIVGYFYLYYVLLQLDMHIYPDPTLKKGIQMINEKKTWRSDYAKLKESNLL